MRISKLGAAKRQLETAIWLYFNDGDPVSTHTLTAAAYNVIRAVNEKQQGPPMIVKDFMVGLMRPEDQKMWRGKVNEAENYFKHADRDHAAEIDFDPGQSEILLRDAIFQYYVLTGTFTYLFQLFQVWYVAHHPDVCNLTEDDRQWLPTVAPLLTTMSKPEYFTTVLPLIQKKGSPDRWAGQVANTASHGTALPRRP